ncbi:MAG: hypothetical protein AB1765_05150, partial [Candidatus Hydrogenedentota bacterium]
IQVPGFLVNFMDYIEWAQSQRHSTIYELTWSPYIGHIRYLLSSAEPDLFFILTMSKGVNIPALLFFIVCILTFIISLYKLLTAFNKN